LIILGEDMPADRPTYAVGPHRRVQGSSVATALASGIASLLLMVAAKKGEQSWKKLRSKKNLLDLFAKMRPAINKSLPFVDPQLAFMAIKTISDGEGIQEDVHKYLEGL
jgi:hypothetical protein